MTSSPTPNRAARRSPIRRAGAVGSGSLLIGTSAAALLTALAAPAGASTQFIVDSTADGAATPSHCTDGTAGNCTIRDAAAASIDGDSITIDPSLVGSTIELTQGEIALGAVSIFGPGAADFHITTQAAPNSYNMFYFGGTGDVTVSGISFSKNRLKSNNSGNFTLDGVEVTGSSSGYGGALYAGNDGDLEITNSQFDGNTVNSRGGAIYGYNVGDVTISDSDFTNNTATDGGGGIFVSSNVVNTTINTSNITGNTADYGGGLYITGSSSYPNSTQTITDSTISNNTAETSGGGAYIETYGTVTINRTTVDGNTAAEDGGGLYFGGEVPRVEILASTISNNTAGTASNGKGAGVKLHMSGSGDALIANSTFTGNSTAGDGGALYVGAPVEIDQTTIVGNTAAVGGAIQVGDVAVTVSGSVITANTSTVSPGFDDDIHGISSPGGVVNASDSMIGYYANVTFNDGGGVIISHTPGLGALADNGGPTMTMLPDATSDLIDAGPDPVASFPENGYDQRGLGFDRVVNGTSDIGAVEVQPEPEPTTTTTQGTDPVVPEFTG